MAAGPRHVEGNPALRKIRVEGEVLKMIDEQWERRQDARAGPGCLRKNRGHA